MLPHTVYYAQDVFSQGKKEMYLFLAGTSWDPNNVAMKQEHMGALSGDSSGSTVSHMFLFFGYSHCVLLPVVTEEHSCRTGKREKK